MKDYNEMKKETDAMPDGEKKTVLKKVLKGIRDAEKLQKKYEALSEEERKRLDEFIH